MIEQNDFFKPQVLVSVIIPLYNKEEYIRHTLDSVLKQTLKNFEIIIVDDDSTDLSYDIALSYANNDKRIRAYQIDNSGTPSRPRNIGIELAEGQYITFLDADDILSDNALELLFKKAKSLKAEITFCADAIYNSNGVLPEYLNDREALSIDDKLLTKRATRKHLFRMTCWGALIQTSFLKKSGIKFNEEVCIVEDQLFIVNVILSSKKIACVNEILYYYNRSDGDALSTNKRVRDFINSVFSVLKIFDKLFYEKAQFLFEDFREILLEIKLIRLAQLEWYADNKFFKEIFNPSTVLLEDDNKYFYNIIDDGYKLFDAYHWWLDMSKNNYNKIFYKHFNGYESSQFFGKRAPIIKTVDPCKFNNTKPIIPIVFSVSNNYIIFFECALLSLLKNSSKSYNYHIIIFEKKWDAVCKNSITSRYTRENVKFTFYKIQDLFLDANSLETDHRTVDMYTRLIIPSLLSAYEKCIYLDSDIIVNDDISKLFEIDLEDKFLGAAVDYSAVMHAGYYSELGVPINTYFNAGVLLWDLQKTKESNLVEEIIEAFYQRNDYRVVEQDILNIIFANKTKILDYRWNYQVEGELLESKDLMLQEQALIDSQNDIAIIHYTTTEKPWLNRNRDKSKYFWDIAKETMHYELILMQCARYQFTGII